MKIILAVILYVITKILTTLFAVNTGYTLCWASLGTKSEDSDPVLSVVLNVSLTAIMYSFMMVSKMYIK